MITGAGAVIEALRVGYGDSIAIFGTGGVGLAAVMAAKLCGAQHIRGRRHQCRAAGAGPRAGATHAFHSEDDAVKQIRAVTGRGVRCSLNTTTVPAVHGMALDVLAMKWHRGFRCRAARAVGTAECSACWPVAGNCAAFSAATRIQDCSLPRLIDYWRQGRFPFDRLLTFYRFDEIARAFADVHEGRVIKPVLLMPGAA